MNYKEYKHLVAMDSARYEKEKKNPILFYLTNKTYRLTIRFRRVQLLRGKRLLLPCIIWNVYYTIVAVINADAISQAIHKLEGDTSYCTVGV